MPFKSIMRELREMKSGFGGMSRRVGVAVEGRCGHGGKEEGEEGEEELGHHQWLEKEEEQGQWANLTPELLLDIIQRLEANEVAWPARRHVVACASVCRSWRNVTREVVQTLEKCGRFTFPISLKQPGPREFPIQCFVRRDRASSTYRLYLGLSPSLHGEKDKFLLAARKFRRAMNTSFVISLSFDDFSCASNSYVGKLRSNFLGTKFVVFDSQPPCDVMTQAPFRRKSRQVAPRAPAGKYNISTISYELNVLRARGPRRMNCAMHSIPISSLQEGGTAPTPTGTIHLLDEHMSTMSSERKEPTQEFSLTSLTSEFPLPLHAEGEPLVLKNKAPRWHEQLQCWCLNFRGRVTVASVKNFQLVAATDPSHGIPATEQEKVILQFGKIGKDIFTMDYRYPLSAFQAFAICLSSFDTKPACE